MFRKTIIIKGLIILLAIGVLAALGWTGVTMTQQKANRPQEDAETTTSTQAIGASERSKKFIEELNKLEEDFNKKMEVLQKTYEERLAPIEEKMVFWAQKAQEMLKAGNEEEYRRLSEESDKYWRESWQLKFWFDDQKRLLEQEKAKQIEELVKKYLEPYVMKEVLFVPWGSGKGEAVFREIEFLEQDIAPVTDRYGPSLEVDEEGNIYIVNKEWGKLERGQKEVKRIDNPYIHKYGKIKVKKGNVYEEKYQYLTSFSLKEIKKSPSLIKKKSSNYLYEIYRLYPPEERDRLALRVIDVTTKETIGNIHYVALSDGETYLANPLGDDAFGNIYVLVDNTLAGRGSGYGHVDWILKVHKYNKEGDILAIIELFKDIGYLYRYEGQKDRIKIDKEGNIYQLVGKEDGVHVLKWEIKK